MNTCIRSLRYIALVARTMRICVAIYKKNLYHCLRGAEISFTNEEALRGICTCDLLSLTGMMLKIKSNDF